jgi:hypothetical protein
MKRLLALAATAQLCFAANPFHARSDYPIGPNGFLRVADVNGDGIPDLVENYVNVDFGPGPTSTPVDNFLAFQMGDFNGDGRLDILTAGYLSQDDPKIVVGVAVMFSNGDGTFSNGTITQTASSPYSVQFAVVGDFNQDGKLDVALAETAYSGQVFAKASRIVTLFGNGDGTFSHPVTTVSPHLFSSAVEPSHTFITADFNGDGYPDVAVQTLNGIQVFLNRGNGAFQAGAYLAINSSTPLLGLAAADMSGDGKVDIVGALGGTSGSAFVALGNGNGSFQTPISSAFPGQGQIAVGDVNGDGVPDVVAAQLYSVAVAFGKGNGAFNAASTFSSGYVPENIALADLLGDGRLDIISGNFYSSSILLNEGTGKFSDTPLYPSGEPGCVAVADFNGDGHPDVAMNQSNGSVTVAFGTGNINAVFSGYATSSLNQPGGCAAAGDFNNDGIQDLAMVSDYKLYIDLGKGNGAFDAGQPIQIQPQTNGPICVGDFNGDGKLDLAFATGAIALGNGDGTFQPEIILPILPEYGTEYCAAADLNGDGITDLVLTNVDPGEIYVYLGNKAANFQYQVYSTNYGGGGQVAIADFNGDGIPDIAASIDIEITTLLGNGEGAFTVGPAFTYPSGTLLQSSYLMAGDFDNNGTTDLAAAVPSTGYVAVLSGNGNGTFTLEDFLGGVSPMQGAALANLHGQSHGHGGPDIVQAGGTSLAAMVNTTPTK